MFALSRYFLIGSEKEQSQKLPRTFSPATKMDYFLRPDPLFTQILQVNSVRYNNLENVGRNPMDISKESG